MCGIAGLFHPEGQPPPEEATLRAMLGALRHRGPDDAGIYLDERAGLGHVRLSIIDLASGHQPLSNEDGTVWITFNGEIFNYLEIREELLRRGHRFATRSDTEVIVHLYEDLGPDCFSLLNGQFALAIRDLRNDTLLLARDRLGVRPLFYTRQNGRLAFASEIKALLTVPGVPARLRPGALHELFTYWSPVPPATAFEEIVELPPAHHLLIGRAPAEPQRYWQFRFPPGGGPRRAAIPPRQIQDWTEELEFLLSSATRLRLRADVPVGAYLSGGLDSSLIAAFVRRATGQRLRTFSIAFTDPRFDESAHQLQVARHFGADHRVAHAGPAEIGEAFRDVVWHTETPIVRTSPAPMYLLSRLVACNGIKVVLTGEGADEFLAGYDLFKEAAIRRFWARQPGSLLRPALLRRLYPDIPAIAEASPEQLRMFFAGRLDEAGAPAFSHAIRWRNGLRAARFFTAGLRHAAPAPLPPLPPGFAEWGPLSRAQYLECATFLSPYLLCSQGDRPAMAHSIEGRFPFLDVRVVEFCNALPECVKLRGLREKFLLRQVAARHLPPEVSARPKRPYRAPIHACFTHPATLPWVEELLSESSLRAAGLFEPAAAARLLAHAVSGQPVSETDDMALAGILSATVLHRNFLAVFRPAPPLGARDLVQVDKRSLAPC